MNEKLKKIILVEVVKTINGIAETAGVSTDEGFGELPKWIRENIDELDLDGYDGPENIFGLIADLYEMAEQDEPIWRYWDDNRKFEEENDDE